MTRYVAVAGLLLLLGFAPVAGADTRSEISAVLDYFAEVWNEGDADAMRGYYHPDFVGITSSGAVNLEQRMETFQILVGPGEDRGELSFTDVVVEPMGSQNALAWGHSRVTFKDGTSLDTWFSTVYVKTPFGWKALLTHN